MTTFTKQLRAWRRKKARMLISPDYVLGLSAEDYGQRAYDYLKRRQDAAKAEITSCPSPDKGKVVSVAILGVYATICLFAGEVL